MRVADFLAQKLYEAGIGDVFLVTGGGMMFLTDGLACQAVTASQSLPYGQITNQNHILIKIRYISIMPILMIQIII